MPRKTTRKVDWVGLVQTDKGYHNWLKSNLRRLHSRWPVAIAARNEAKVVTRRRKKSGPGYKRHVAWKCADCKGVFSPRRLTQLDHIMPVVPVGGWNGWGVEIERLFVRQQSGYQVLCKPCHSRKSVEENARRRTVANGSTTDGNAA